MTTREEEHQLTVRHLISSFDEEECQHVLPLVTQYREARWGLRAAIHHLNKLNSMMLDEGGYLELVNELRAAIAALRSDEISVLEMHADYASEEVSR